MTIVVLLFLAGIWGVVLYGYFRERMAETRPADSIGSFRRQLSVLERTGPVSGRVAPRHRLADLPASPVVRRAPAVRAAGAVGGPAVRRRGPSQAQKRRRDIIFGLFAAMGGSLLLSFLPGLKVMLGLHLVLDALFVAYIALLIRQRNIVAEREMKLRFLPGASSAPEPALLLRRSVN